MNQPVIEVFRYRPFEPATQSGLPRLLSLVSSIWLCVSLLVRLSRPKIEPYQGIARHTVPSG